MSNVLRDTSDVRGVQRAPEVFIVLNALFRPAQVPELVLPELKTPIRPYVAAEYTPVTVEEVNETVAVSAPGAQWLPKPL